MFRVYFFLLISLVAGFVRGEEVDPQKVSGVYVAVIQGLKGLGANFYRYELQLDIPLKTYLMRVQELDSPVLISQTIPQVYEGTLILRGDEIELSGDVKPRYLLILPTGLLASFELKIPGRDAVNLGSYSMVKKASIYPKGINLEESDRIYKKLQEDEEKAASEEPKRSTFSVIKEE